MSDLDFLGVSNVVEIGNNYGTVSQKNGNYFGGTFDGNYCSIRNLSITRVDVNGIGVFGYIHGGIVQNLRRIGGSNTAKDSVGGIVGRIYEGTAVSYTHLGRVVLRRKFNGAKMYTEAWDAQQCAW